MSTTRPPTLVGPTNCQSVPGAAGAAAACARACATCAPLTGLSELSLSAMYCSRRVQGSDQRPDRQRATAPARVRNRPDTARRRRQRDGGDRPRPTTTTTADTTSVAKASHWIPLFSRLSMVLGSSPRSRAARRQAAVRSTSPFARHMSEGYWLTTGGACQAARDRVDVGEGARVGPAPQARNRSRRSSPAGACPPAGCAGWRSRALSLSPCAGACAPPRSRAPGKLCRNARRSSRTGS